MNITVIGAGYVGLVTGTCLAEVGNHVLCVDIDDQKIKDLKQGIIPIYEDKLEQLVKENLKEQRLSFSTILNPSHQTEIYFIAVGTPSDKDGSADLQYVTAAAQQIGQHIEHDAIIVNKSTVPVYTAEKVQQIIGEQLRIRKKTIQYDVISSPEFLKEGSAIKDFMEPDRVIIGTDNEQSRQAMKELYTPFIKNPEQMIFMSVRESEMAKYVSNAMLASRISFMNEIATLCEKVGADVNNVRLGVGSDTRIGYSFLHAGCGYGGSCLPKDVKALIHTAKAHNINPLVLQAIEDRNQQQKHTLFDKLEQHGRQPLDQLKVALWGLAFKPNTDDMREASSTIFLQQAMAAGVNVCAYDPVAMTAARQQLPKKWFDSGQLQFVNHQLDAIIDSDVLLLATEWLSFRSPDFLALKATMRGDLIIDGRNQYSPEQVKAAGLRYIGIGRC